MVNQLHGRMIISRMLICFSTIYYDIISLTNLKITQAFHLLLDFAENQITFWDLKIRNNIQITKGLDNGDLDNRGSTVIVINYNVIFIVLKLCPYSYISCLDILYAQYVLILSKYIDTTASGC